MLMTTVRALSLMGRLSMTAAPNCSSCAGIVVPTAVVVRFIVAVAMS